MDESVIYYVEIRMAQSRIKSLAFQSAVSIHDGAKAAFAHEIGHALGIDHAPPSGGLCNNLKSIMEPVANYLFNCDVFDPNIPCDSEAVYQSYPA